MAEKRGHLSQLPKGLSRGSYKPCSGGVVHAFGSHPKPSALPDKGGWTRITFGVGGGVGLCTCVIRDAYGTPAARRPAERS